jgi:hypothetical protein
MAWINPRVSARNRVVSPRKKRSFMVPPMKSVYSVMGQFGDKEMTADIKKGSRVSQKTTDS